MEPLTEYIDTVQGDGHSGYVTVILPEFVPRRLWHHLLHNQHALLIKSRAAVQTKCRGDERAVPPRAERSCQNLTRFTGRDIRNKLW
jgi:hypothetical protein